MLTKVRIYNEAGVYAEMPFGVDPAVGGYSARKIDGLGPVKADIAYSDYVLLPGGVFNSASTGVRNLVFSVAYRPNYSINQTVQDMRTDLYSIVLPGEKVRMYFYIDGVWTYWTEGWVETHEPNIFSAEPTVAISIMCVEMTTFADPDPIVRNLQTGTNNTVAYNGNSPRGFIVETTLSSAVTYFQVRRTLPTYNQIIQINKSMPSGTRLYIQLEEGFKSAAIVNSSGASIENLMGRVQVVNEWPKLFNGNNTISFFQSAGVSDVKMTYRNHYVGI